VAVPHIFVSYSRNDAAFARRLTDSLQQIGSDVWIDVADIRSGEDWSDAIQQALDQCDVMLLVISPEAMESVNVASEWKYYLDEGKTVIPVLLRESRIHFRLKPLNYIDFQRQEYDIAFDQLRAQLEHQGITFAPPDKTPDDAGPRPPDDGRSFQTLALGVAIAVLALAAVILAASTLLDFNGKDGQKSGEPSPQEIAQTLIAQRDATQTAAALVVSPSETPPGTDNHLQNPGFEQPFETVAGDQTTFEVASGWQPWYLLRDESGEHVYSVADYQPAPAERVRSGQAAQAYSIHEGAHDGGVYQQVSATPGTLLRFSVFTYVWSSSNPDNPDVSENPAPVRVTVGIDPRGGTDAASADIVWSEPEEVYDQYREWSVETSALSAAVTVFVRTTQTAVGNSAVYLDDASLIASSPS
jgi:hypothetical protein